jgi:hypothetical protein
MIENKTSKLVISKTLLRLRQGLKAASTKKEKVGMMLSIATQFNREHDIFNGDFNEGYHAHFEEFEQARIVFQQAAMRLARLAVSVIDDEFSEPLETDNSPPEQAPN